jgi:hypothetical protein
MASSATLPSVKPDSRAFGPDSKLVVWVFLLALIGAWLLSANRFALANDEGIYIEGARSILDGKILYKDHFAFTGPGCYWLLASSFALFGTTLPASRVPMVLDFAILCAATGYLLARMVNRQAAILGSLVCFLFLISNPGMQNANHRWDSSAFACLAIVLACSTAYRPNRLATFGSGLAAAAAAWITPPVGLFGAVAAAWLWRRSQLWAYVAGAATCSLAAVLYLAASGSLQPMIDGFLWASSNYSEPNRTGYGMVNGGWAALIQGTTGIGTVITGLVLFAFLVPAIAPLLNLAASPWLLRRSEHPFTRFLLASSIALVLSTYPRMDVAHLLNVFPSVLVLSIYFLGRYRWSKSIFWITITSAILLGAYAIQTRFTAQRVESGVGTLYTSPMEAKAIEYLQSRVAPGQSLYVYPYLPVAYVLTKSINPTPYSFLQPGMMTERDETTALAALKQNPPKFALFSIPRESDMLRIWPNSDRSRLRMKVLERWIESTYEPVEINQPFILGYRLLRRSNSN